MSQERPETPNRSQGNTPSVSPFDSPSISARSSADEEVDYNRLVRSASPCISFPVPVAPGSWPNLGSLQPSVHYWLHLIKCPSGRQGIGCYKLKKGASFVFGVVPGLQMYESPSNRLRSAVHNEGGGSSAVHSGLCKPAKSTQ